jgi:hypothetical protein
MDAQYACFCPQHLTVALQSVGLFLELPEEFVKEWRALAQFGLCRIY